MAALVAFDRVQPVVEEIAQAIVSLLRNVEEPCALAEGALFLAYLARASDDAAAAANARALLLRACERASERPMPWMLYGGFLGVAWARAHVIDQVEDDDGVETAVEEVLREGWGSDFDLIRGLVGIGVYALERRAHGSRSDLLEVVVDRLAERAERCQPGVAWRTDARLLQAKTRSLHPEGWHDLGLAHGVPGAIVLLAGAHAVGVARARPLLDEAVAFLLAHRLPPGSASCFPVAAQKSEHCPTAWCYGDPGVAMALLVAARAVREPDWEREAVELARLVARRPPRQCGVREASLCHGAAGLAHIFHRFYRATGEPGFRSAAAGWMRATLALRKPGIGVAGYRTLVDEEWVDDPGFLTGAAGIGLALVAAATEIEPAWDRVLLCSLAV